MNFFTLITAFAVLYIEFYQNGKLLSSGILSPGNEKRQEPFEALPLFSYFIYPGASLSEMYIV